MRPFACSTIVSTTALRSASVRVKNSLAFTGATTPPAPAATQKSTHRRSDPMSRSPSGVKGVTGIANTPRNEASREVRSLLTIRTHVLSADASLSSRAAVSKSVKQFCHPERRSSASPEPPPPRRISHAILASVSPPLTQVRPRRIHRSDQADLPLPSPALDLLLALDRGSDIR